MFKRYDFPRDNKIFLIAAGLVITAFFLPALIYGARSSDDMPWHLIWFESYREALQHGVLYPRWMPDAMDGMGSPAFFFYPPFATFFFALIDTLSFRLLSAPHVIGLSAMLMGLASGGAFYLWVRNFTGIAVAAALGTAYAVAPYHLLTDYYTRGAMGEYAAYIWVPLMFLAVQRYVSTSKAPWLVVLAFSVIGMFTTHLLTAMVVGPVIAVYAVLTVFRARRPSGAQPWMTLLSMAAFASLGVGVCAFYFVPAIKLFDFANTAALYMRPIEGTKLFSDFSFGTHPVAKLSLFASVYLAITAYVCVEYARRPRSEEERGAAAGAPLLWVVVIGLCAILMWGKLAFVFAPPSPYRSLQFLWRLLVLVEFATLTLVAVSFPRLHGAARKRMATVLLLIFSLVSLYQAQALVKRFSQYEFSKNEVGESSRVKYRVTPPEYYPKDSGFPAPVAELLVQLKPHLGAEAGAQVVSGVASLDSVRRDYSTFVIRAVVREPALVAIRQFYFPGWVAEDGAGNFLPVVAATPYRFAAVELAPGTHTIQVRRAPLPAQLLGNRIALISALALLLLIASLSLPVVARRRRAAKAF